MELGNAVKKAQHMLQTFRIWKQRGSWPEHCRKSGCFVAFCNSSVKACMQQSAFGGQVMCYVHWPPFPEKQLTTIVGR